MFVRRPFSSIKLNKVFEKTGSVSGYKINQSKSVMSGYKVSQQMQQDLLSIFPAIWQKANVRYLRIRICTNNESMVQENVEPVIVYIEQKCRLWEAYELSWLGHRWFCFPNCFLYFLLCPWILRILC